LWDKSKEKPASSILSDYKYRLTSLHWTTEEENQELVMLGDEVGNILSIDPRTPNKILNTTSVSNRPISKFSFNGSKRFGVISNSNVISVVETNNSNEPLKLVHKYAAPSTLNDMCWDSKDKNIFYVVGDKQFALKITLAL
jgi:hypothetical protein